MGHVNVITVPNAVSLFDASAPIPDVRGGQSGKIMYTTLISFYLDRRDYSYNNFIIIT